MTCIAVLFIFRLFRIEYIEVLSMSKRIRCRFLIPAYILVLITLLLTALAGSRAVSVMAERKPIESRRCVIIDAGHGGVDGGTTSCTGVLESALNLEIALRLNDLMHLLGIDTQMIRTTDESVYTEGGTIAAKKVSDLKQRVKIANSTDNSVLISIHQNYFSDQRYSGAQVFYAPTPGSMELAKMMQTSLIKTVNPESKRQIKKADGIYLMQKIDCTGVLVECGFLSNPIEEANLRREDYQKKLCSVISATTSCYLYRSSIA